MKEIDSFIVKLVNDDNSHNTCTHFDAKFANIWDLG